MYTFKEVIGHEQIINHLQSSIAHKKVSHAYIFDGAAGMGKELLAGTFAKTLQCLEGGIEPCNECVSCKTFDSGNHPDIIYVTPTKRKTIGVDDIREQIQKTIEIKPYQYEYKVYIIDDADTITVQAQNALLKTIEEPPHYGILVLLSSNYNRFLQTILSRCVLLKLKPISNEKIKQYLMKNLQIPDYQADIYVSFSQGNIGRAKEIAISAEFMEMREQVIKWTEGIGQADLMRVFEIQKEFENYKDQIQEVLDIFYTWYRDVLLVKQLGKSPYVIHQDKQKILLKQGSLLSYNKIGKILEAIQAAKHQISRNSNFQLTIEVMLLKLKES